MTGSNGVSVAFGLLGAFFLVLAIAPLAVFDRVSFWSHQAKWFRANKLGMAFGRVMWASFGAFLWVIAMLLLRH